MLKKSVVFFTILGIVQSLAAYAAVQYFSVPWDVTCRMMGIIFSLISIVLVLTALFAREHRSNYLIGVLGFFMLSTAWRYGFSLDSNSFLRGVDSIVGILPLMAAGLVLLRAEPSVPIWRVLVSLILIDTAIWVASENPLLATNEGVVGIIGFLLVAGLLAYAVAAIGRKSDLRPSQA